MILYQVQDNAVLPLIAATLSLLLLAGMFGSGSDTDEAQSTKPAEKLAGSTRRLDSDNSL